MTKSLSPAAQAVMDAFTNAACGETYQLRPGIAAALRAVADQHMPEPLPFTTPDFKAGAYSQRSITSYHILAIAAELEGQPLPQPPTQPTTEPC